MKCEEAAELLPGLLTGSLSGRREQEVLAHLAGCGECRAELAFWAQVRQAAEAGAEDMPEELFKGIREALIGERRTGVVGTLKSAGRALGLAGSVCRLALSAAGIHA